MTTALYGNLALRQFNDLDILLRPGDMLATRDALLARGYTSQHHFDSHAHEAAHLRHDCEYNLISPDGFVVELHWRIRPRYFPIPIEFDDLAPRFQSTLLGGAAICTLSAEDLLLILCVHGEKHY